MKKIIAWALCLVLLFTCLNALAASEATMESITVASTTPMTGNFFSTAFGNNSSDLDVQTLLHSYHLVRWDKEQGIFVIDESVVTGTMITENGQGDRTYHLSLAQDMVYSDGSPITAWDYAFSILLSLAPQMEEIGATIDRTGRILGAQDWQDGAADCLAGVRVVGDYQLAITLSHEALPYFYEYSLLNFCPYPISQIAPDCRVADDGNGIYLENAAAFTAETLSSTLLDEETGYLTHPTVVSGAYTLVSYDGETACFALNDLYLGDYAGIKPEILEITFGRISNEDMTSSLLSGDVELINRVSNAESITALLGLRAQTNNYAASTYLRAGLCYLSFCCEKATVQETAVRQAIAMCLNKEQVIADSVGNFGLTVDGYYGLGQWMVMFMNGTVAAPVEEPEENASQEETAAYEEELEKWEALSMDGLTLYAFDVEGAKELLNKNGWNLNTEGNPFQEGTDSIRCKKITDEQGNETLVALDLTLAYPEGNLMAQTLETNLGENLAQVGISLTLEGVSLEELEEMYYRRSERDYDLLLISVNFGAVFDPAMELDPDGVDVTGLGDTVLLEKARDITSTQAGDLLSYMEKWLAFEEYWTEILPGIGLYSNAYFDVYVDTLHSYDITLDTGWGEAIVTAYLSDESDLEDEADAEFASEYEDSGEEEFEDEFEDEFEEDEFEFED